MLYVGEKFHVVCEFKIIIIAAKKILFVMLDLVVYHTVY